MTIEHQQRFKDRQDNKCRIIRDRRDRQLVTLIELLSPANKRPGGDRDQYLAKRHEVLRSTAHLVEIDLLRGGQRPPLEQFLLDTGPHCTLKLHVKQDGLATLELMR